MTSAATTLEQVVGAATARFGWPGCSAVVVQRGEPDAFRCWGAADATGRPVDEETGFRIASTGKTLTAMALMSLVDQGLVDLDDPLDKHVRGLDIQSEGPPIRLRHLASHTAGLGDLLRWRDVLQPRAGAGVRPGHARPTLDELYRDGVPVPLPPGVVWRYANHGITLLGSVVESVTGLGFDAAVEKLVLRPLGMDQTGFESAMLQDPRTATGYADRKGQRKEVPVLDITVAPAGSAISRATDMAKYLRAMLGRGSNEAGQALGGAAFDELLTPLHQPDLRQTQTSVAWWLNRVDGHRMLRHGGAWSGFRSACLVAPDDGVALWIGVNNEEDLVEQVGFDLLRELLGIRSSKQECADLAAGSHGGSPPPPGRYLPVGTGLSTLTNWAAQPRGITVRATAGVSALVGRGAWSHGFPLVHIGVEDPTLFAADLGGANAVNQGWTTVQAIGTSTQPALLLNGRTPYVRATDGIRSWLPLERLEATTRVQLEGLSLY